MLAGLGTSSGDLSRAWNSKPGVAVLAGIDYWKQYCKLHKCCDDSNLSKAFYCVFSTEHVNINPVVSLPQ